MIKMSFINKKKTIISIYNSGSGLSTNERKEKRIVDGLTTRRAEQKLLIPVRDKSQNKNNVLNPFGEKKKRRELQPCGRQGVLYIVHALIFKCNVIERRIFNEIKNKLKSIQNL